MAEKSALTPLRTGFFLPLPKHLTPVRIEAGEHSRIAVAAQEHQLQPMRHTSSPVAASSATSPTSRPSGAMMTMFRWSSGDCAHPKAGISPPKRSEEHEQAGRRAHEKILYRGMVAMSAAYR